jgi:small subunit ribosomal protein S1
VGLEEGIDGLVHVSDLSWTDAVKHPSEQFTKGDIVEAVVLKVDRENEKFSLGIKQLLPNPWDGIQKKYPVGSEIVGPITSVTDFGVFVRLEDGIEGLVYSSELAAEKIEKPQEHFNEGQEVTSLVIKVDPAEQKISLSIRAVGDKAERAALKKLAAEQASTQTTTLGDLLAEKLGQAASAEAAEKAAETTPAEPAAAEESPDTGDEASGPGSKPTEDSSSEEA